MMAGEVMMSWAMKRDEGDVTMGDGVMIVKVLISLSKTVPGRHRLVRIWVELRRRQKHWGLPQTKDILEVMG